MMISINPPYHFGWYHDDDGGGTYQIIDVEKEFVIYKNNEQHMQCLLVKERKEHWEKIEFVKEDRTLSSLMEVVVYGPGNVRKVEKGES
jgi:hypothetical protein